MTSIIADSSQIAVFDSCPTLWYWRYIEQITKAPFKENMSDLSPIEKELMGPGEEKKEKLNAALMGTCGHHALEHWYWGEKNIKRAIQYAYDKIYEDSNGDPTKRLTSTEESMVENILLLYAANYSINPDFKVIGPPEKTLEVGFSEEIFNDGNRQFILEGRIDIANAVEGNGNAEMSVDHKFQLSARPLYERCIQFRNYNLITGKNFFTVNYVRFHKNPGKDTFQRVHIPFSPIDRISWKKELIGIYNRMANFKEKIENAGEGVVKEELGVIMGERRRSNCASGFGKCQYIPLCDSHNVPELLSIKTANYRFEEAHRPW